MSNRLTGEPDLRLSLTRSTTMKEILRRASCTIVLLAVLSLVALTACESPEKLSPLSELQSHLPVSAGANVIVISFDALRRDALGLYGGPPEISPRLDAFAKESVVFERAYTVAPVTPTSFAAAFTGLLPHRVFHAWNLVYDDTLATRFSAEGYRTAAFIHNIQLTQERNFQSGFATYEVYHTVSDELILDNALSWLQENSNEKIFTWIHFLSPHSPYDYREMAAHFYDPEYDGEFKTTSGQRFDTDDPVEVARIRSLYDGEVFYADHLFGQLIDGIRSAGLMENSIILVTSDHGEEFKEHGGFQHDRLTEEHVQIPLLIRHPARRAPLRTPILTSNVDFFPTLLSLVGIEHDVQLDGRNLIGIEEEPDWLAGVSMSGALSRWLSLRKGPFKLIRTCTPEDDLRLFELESDPLEKVDLAADMPDKVRELHSELGVVMGGEPCTVMQAAIHGASPEVGLSQENIRALKALGYL